MDSIDFLSAVLPTQGKYCVYTARGQLKKNLFVSDIDNLYQTNIDLSEKGQQTYYALASFDDEGTRKATSAQFMRTIAMDLDCGEGKAFTSKKAAVAALVTFLQDTKLNTLGEPWLVDSGGGVHVYWPLNEDTEVDTWKPVAETMKRVAKQFNFPLDMTVTADASRVLRMPGTTNWKYTPPKPVRLIMRGGVFVLDDIADTLAKLAPAAPPMRPMSTALALPGKRPSAVALSPVAQAMAGNSVTYFRNIMVRTAAGTGCGQVQYYVDNATQDGMEPLWRALLSIAKVCDDAAKATRKLSAMHPYDEDRMLQKLGEIRGPYACAKFNTENPGICEKCPHWGKITNPLALGREVLTVTEPTVLELPGEDDDEPVERIVRPTPPRGFSFGKNGGVYYHKKDKEVETEVMLTSYDLFMTRMFRDGTVYQSEFTVIKGRGTDMKRITFTVPHSVITSQAECIKQLASNNVIGALGPNCDRYLWEYVRACVQDASVTENVVNIPPRYGWQEDSSFAVGDMVFSAHSPTYNYSFVSDRMHNLITATRTKGTLEDWRRVFEMMREKKMWGHLAVAGAGFGSILMQFMPSGSRAVTLHLCSKDTGAGKTLAQAMATSIWGDSEKYLVAPSTSERTMMQRAGLLGSLPLCVDEITSNNRELNREWLPKFIFDYAAGMHKIKGSASGNTEIQHETVWSSIAIITSNTPGLEAMMGARTHTSEGEARRFLEWEQGAGSKIIWAPSEREILKLLEHNYGHAGRAFAQWCVLNTTTVRRVLDEIAAMWRTESGATDEERFWTSGVVCMLAGYILAGPRYANIVSIPISPLFQFWATLVQRQRKIIAGNQTTALDVLNAYIREHNGNLVRAEGSVVMQQLGKTGAIQPNSSKSIIRGRVEYDIVPGYVDFFIEVKMLKLHCADVSMGYSAFLQELERVATVREMSKDLLAGTKGPSMRVSCIKVTRAISAVEADDL